MTSSNEKDVSSQLKSTGSDTRNPTQAIIVYDMPGRIRQPFSTLVTDVDSFKQTIASGDVISEIGMPRSIKLPFLGCPIIGWLLRKGTSERRPKFVFGGTDLGFSYSMLLPKLFAVPAQGSRLTINPWITAQQKALMEMYQFHKAKCLWVVSVPSPFGVALVLNAFAPEFDDTTVTKGVRWKPNAVTEMAFLLEWSNDFSLVHSSGRLGQSGLALTIENVADNTAPTVASPLNMTVWCCVYDIRSTSINSGAMTSLPEDCPAFNFYPQQPAPPKPDNV